MKTRCVVFRCIASLLIVAIGVVGCKLQINASYVSDECHIADLQQKEKILQQMEQTILDANTAYIYNMNQLAPFQNIAKYMLPNSKLYAKISSAQSGNKWAGKPDKLDILEMQIADISIQDDKSFTATTDILVARKYRGVNYKEEMSFVWTYIKQGKQWLISDMKIVDTLVRPEGDNWGVDPSTANATAFGVSSVFDQRRYVENGIEFHEIVGDTFTGTMMVVADPSRVFVGTPRDSYNGQAGLSVPQIADRYGAIAAVNGGFFVDTNGAGDGGTPLGLVVSNGKLMAGGTTTVFNMMGFDETGTLICGKMTGQQALDQHIRDGLTCNTFLVLNGKAVNVSGVGGGLNPRTAIGQRADKAVLILVIDGRQATSMGAYLTDVVAVMQSFGAVNAGNLDGGGSTALYYNGAIRNVVMSIYGARGEPNAVCVSP